MLNCYGDYTLLRVLDETEFWKHQEAEHTVVIRTIAPDLDEAFIAALCSWEKVLTETQGAAIRYVETAVRDGKVCPEYQMQIHTFLCCALHQSQEFIKLLDQILDTGAVRNNPVAETVVKHIRRESEYYIGVTQAVLCKLPPPRTSCKC